MGKTIDITGDVFGRLTAREITGKDKHRGTLWLCTCVCGNEVVVRSSALRRGNTVSCGCYKKEVNAASLRNRRTTHGQTRTPSFRSWESMQQRCYNPHSGQFQWYGLRGVMVCDAWKGEKGFDNFISDLGRRPLGKTLDRIDTDGNYCPDNCRWVLPKQQANNRTNNVRLTFRGETKTLAQWAESTGLAYGTLYSRVSKGWSLDRALVEPARPKR